MAGERHWFDVGDLPRGRDLVVQIEAAKPGTIDAVMRGKKQQTRCVSVKLAGFPRPLGCKSLLSKQITAVVGSGEVNDWVGKWIALYADMIDDPNGEKGPDGRRPLIEAVRVRPIAPTAEEIEAARGKPASKAAAPARDQAADMRLVDQVGAAIDAARTEAEVEAAIAPHRAAMKGMDERLLNVLASAKKVRLAAIAAAGGGGS